MGSPGGTKPLEKGGQATPSTSTQGQDKVTGEGALREQTGPAVIERPTSVKQDCPEEFNERVDELMGYAKEKVDRVQRELDALSTEAEREALLAEKYKVGPEVMSDALEAVGHVVRIKAAGRLGCYRMSFTRSSHSARYIYNDGNSNDEIRNSMNVRGSSLSTRMVHEGLHAVHAHRYPKLSLAITQLNRDIEARFGGGDDDGAAVEIESDEALTLAMAEFGDRLQLSYVWNAWTEYWAYRRYSEYSNNLEEDAFVYKRYDADYFHRTTMLNKSVNGPIAILSARGYKMPNGNAFDPLVDPALWIPPEYR